MSPPRTKAEKLTKEDFLVRRKSIQEELDAWWGAHTYHAPLEN